MQKAVLPPLPLLVKEQGGQLPPRSGTTDLRHNQPVGQELSEWQTSSNHTVFSITQYFAKETEYPMLGYKSSPLQLVSLFSVFQRHV